MDDDDVWDDDESSDIPQPTSNETFNKDLDKLEEKHFNVHKKFNWTNNLGRI